MPIIEAASRSNEVARIARPICVRATKIVSATMRQTVVTITKSCMYWIAERPDRDAREERPGVERERVVLLRSGPEADDRELLQEERDAERADQRRDPRRRFSRSGR